MIAKELAEDMATTANLYTEENNFDRDAEHESVKNPKVNEYPIEKRYRHRYNEVGLQGKQYLATRSCRHCYGTGICGWIVEDKNRGIERQAIYCRCLIKPKENS